MEAHGAQGPPSASQAPPPGFRCVSHAPLSGRWLTLTHRPLFSARTHPSPPPPPPPRTSRPQPRHLTEEVSGPRLHSTSPPRPRPLQRSSTPLPRRCPACRPTLPKHWIRVRMAAGLAGARGPGSRSSRWSASSTKRSVLQAAARWPSAPTALLRTARRGLFSCGSRQCRRLAWKAPRGAPSLGSQRGCWTGLPSRQPGLGTSPLPSLSRPPPRNYSNPMALGKWKGALQRCRVIIYYHTRESREGKGLSRDHSAKKDKART